MNAFFNKLLCFRAFSSFEYGSEKSVVKHDYRVTGFYYVYTTSDGERKIMSVKKRSANHVGGYGVCGVIVPFDKIRLTDFKLKRRWCFFKVKRKYINWMINKDRDNYKLYKSLPKGLSSSELEDIIIENIMNHLCGKK